MSSIILPKVREWAEKCCPPSFPIFSLAEWPVAMLQLLQLQKYNEIWSDTSPEQKSIDLQLMETPDTWLKLGIHCLVLGRFDPNLTFHSSFSSWAEFPFYQASLPMQCTGWMYRMAFGRSISFSHARNFGQPTHSWSRATIRFPNVSAFGGQTECLKAPWQYQPG